MKVIPLETKQQVVRLHKEGLSFAVKLSIGKGNTEFGGEYIMEISKFCEICVKKDVCGTQRNDMEDMKPSCYVEFEMVEYEGDYVPKELCTINRLGEIDDCLPCNMSCEQDNCDNCIITKIFYDYARITDQIEFRKRGS